MGLCYFDLNSNDYYKSHTRLPFIGSDGQQNLSATSVLIVGAGGLGCPCLQMLAGAGIGNIGIVDFDTVHISNLHRQILFTASDLGQPKAMLAAHKLGEANPLISVTAYPVLLNELNVLEIIQPYAVIVDCTDNFFTRYLINDACAFLNKPLVYGAIHQTEGHVTVFNYNNSPGLRCLFPAENNEQIPSCAVTGAYNIVTGIIGNMMANEVIKIILRHPNVMAGKLVQLDVLTYTLRTISYSHTGEGQQKSRERFEANNDKAIIEITAAELKSRLLQPGTVLIDVREAAEHEGYNIGGINLPVSVLCSMLNYPFKSSDNIIVYCQKGLRSRQAVISLQQKGFTNVFSLKGGIDNNTPCF